MADYKGTLKIDGFTALQTKMSENLGIVDASPFFQDSDTAAAYATTLDNFARSVFALTTNTYQKSTVVVAVELQDFT